MYNITLNEQTLSAISKQDIKYILSEKNNKKIFKILLKQYNLIYKRKRVDYTMPLRVKRFREKQKKEKKLLQLYLDSSLKQKLKFFCVENNITMQDYIVNLLLKNLS